MLNMSLLPGSGSPRLHVKRGAALPFGSTVWGEGGEKILTAEQVSKLNIYLFVIVRTNSIVRRLERHTFYYL